MTLAIPNSIDLASLEDLIEQASQYLRASRSPATLRAYESDLRRWGQWCQLRGADPMPADAGEVALFITAEASVGAVPDDDGVRQPVKPGTVARRLSSLKWAHEQAGFDSPTDNAKVRAILAGVKREHHTEPEQRRPIYLEDLRAMVATLDLDTQKGVRDRALLTIGWWSACRRGELSALKVGDLTEDPEGFILRVKRSKTDQEGKGLDKPLAYWPDDPSICPVLSTRAWLDLIDGGHLFRSVSRWDHISHKRLSGEAIARVVKDAGDAVGIDPDTLGGHSLRAGFVSEADRRGVPDRVITSVTGHKSTAMLSTYSRPRSLFKDGPARYFTRPESRISPSEEVIADNTTA